MKEKSAKPIHLLLAALEQVSNTCAASIFVQI